MFDEKRVAQGDILHDMAMDYEPCCVGNCPRPGDYGLEAEGGQWTHYYCLIHYNEALVAQRALENASDVTGLEALFSDRD